LWLLQLCHSIQRQQHWRVYIYGCIFTNIIIPDSIDSISDFAFDYCRSLTRITFPNSVTNIGYCAFGNCTSLTNITIPGSVSSIGDEIFYACQSLSNATIASGVSSIAFEMFDTCTNLTSVFFGGNAPAVVGDGFYGQVFDDDTKATVYYLPGTTGWSNTYWYVPAVPWNPQVQNGGASFGVRSNQFGFNITGTTNIPIVVEACTNLANPVWTPLTNVSLTNGSFYFSDPQWTNYPGRFYGIGFP